MTTEHSSAVAVTDVCMAHVLMRTHAQFQYPEEWQFVHTHQVLLQSTAWAQSSC